MVAFIFVIAGKIIGDIEKILSFSDEISNKLEIEIDPSVNAIRKTLK